MNRFFKPLAFIAAAALILIDCSTLYDVFQMADGKSVFSQIMLERVPCGILFGVTCLLALLEKPAVKPLSVITLAVFGLTAILWIFALASQAAAIAHGTGETGSAEYLLIAEFVGYLLLTVSGLLFMLYLFQKILRRTCLAAIGVSAGVLLVTWVIILVQNIQEISFANGSMTELLGGFLNLGFLLHFLAVAAYVILFAFLTKVLEEPVKPRGAKANG